MDWNWIQNITGSIKVINYYENGEGKKVIGHSKLKLWTLFWSQDEVNDLQYIIICTCTSVFLISSYDTPLAKRASYIWHCTVLSLE